MSSIFQLTSPEDTWGLVDADESPSSVHVRDLPRDRRVADSWQPIHVVAVSEKLGRRSIKTDVPSYSGLVLPDRKLDEGRRILGNDGEFLQLDVRHESTYWYYHCTTVIDALDLQHSQVKMFPDGNRIMRVIKYAFHENILESHSIFQIPQYKAVFYTQSAVEQLLALNLTGLAFEPIPMTQG